MSSNGFACRRPKTRALFLCFEVIHLEGEIHEKDTKGVDQDIPSPTFAKGDKGLVVLVGCGIENRNDRRIEEGFRAHVRPQDSGMKCPKEKEI